MCEIMNRFNIGTRRRFLSEPIPVTIFTLWIFTFEFRYIFDGRIDFASLYLARTSSLNIFDKLVCPAFVHIESLGKLFPEKSFSTHLHLHKYCPFVWNIYNIYYIYYISSKYIFTKVFYWTHSVKMEKILKQKLSVCAILILWRTC